MPDTTNSGVEHTSDGGISGSHAAPDLAAAVAPTTGSDGNRVVMALIPIACWSVGDVRFAFDSSFVRPAVEQEIAQLAALREQHKKEIGEATLWPPVSIFGHADPVGRDDSNKKLSGRRAIAIYALLVRKPDLWEELYTQPFQGDDWGIAAIAEMAGELGFTGDTPQDAVRAFQGANGLAQDGSAGPQTRSKLFPQYMDKLCGDLRLDPVDDFLARGADGGGKGDYQGCGELNPVLMFSQEENERLNREENREERNSENAPNRRVVVFLFRPGLQVTPSKWPCPRAKEGDAGCRLRLWSDAADRRTFQAQRRLYEQTRDTFACRFYDRMADGSPCERAAALLRVRLHDCFGNKMPNVQYALDYSGRQKSGHADANGFLADTLDPDTERCTVSWDPLNSDSGDGGDYRYRMELFVKLLDFDSEDGLARRLHNLGYPADDQDLPAKLRAFQAHHELEVSGEFDDETKDHLLQIYSGALDEHHDVEAGDPSAGQDEQRT